MSVIHVHSAGPASQAAIVAFLERIADVLPKSEAGSRFARLLEVTKSSKVHDYFVLAGPLGAYMLHLCRDINPEQRIAMTLLLQACGDLWEKVIDR